MAAAAAAAAAAGRLRPRHRPAAAGSTACGCFSCTPRTTAASCAPTGKVVHEREWDEDKHADEINSAGDSAHRLRHNWPVVRTDEHAIRVALRLRLVQVNATDPSLTNSGIGRSSFSSARKKPKTLSIRLTARGGGALASTAFASYAIAAAIAMTIETPSAAVAPIFCLLYVGDADADGELRV